MDSPKPQLPPLGMNRRPLIHMRSAPPSSLYVNWRTPDLKRLAVGHRPSVRRRTAGSRRTDSAARIPPATTISDSATDSVCFTTWSCEAARVTGTSNDSIAEAPAQRSRDRRRRMIPQGDSIATSAREVSGSGSVELHEWIFDRSQARRPSGTPCPRCPSSRPRMVGIQSQPMDAWKVGLSAPSTPPFLSVDS